MVIRGTDSRGATFEERTSTENLCRGGVAFATHYALEFGGHVDIRISVTNTPPDDETEFFTQGRIVHLKPGRDAQELIVGVVFTGPRFHRIFVSEETR